MWRTYDRVGLGQAPASLTLRQTPSILAVLVALLALPAAASASAPAASTGEEDPSAAIPSPSSGGGTTIPGSALDQFTTDLTAQARLLSTPGTARSA